MVVDCKEFQEQISPAVDELLQKDVLDSFVQHAQQCYACRNEFELESLTKTTVRTRARMVRAPADLIRRIEDALKREGTTSPAGVQGMWSSLLALPFAKPALSLAAFGVVLVLIFTLSRRSADGIPPAVSPSNNVINQSLANYQAVVSGTFQPQQVSDDPQHLEGFFAGKTDFPVLVPQLSGCTLVGGVLNEHAGTTLAHVVYKREGNIIYMYEACWETVKQGQKLHLPQPVQDGLVRTGWFVETRPDGKSVVLWTKGNTLCAAVAHMSKEDLLACLSSEGNTGGEVW